jgi:proteic killer suppression protein
LKRLYAKIVRILALLDRAARPQDMNLPGFRLHPLKGELVGYWSVTVRANWRIIFRFEDGATDIDLVDYH